MKTAFLGVCVALLSFSTLSKAQNSNPMPNLESLHEKQQTVSVKSFFKTSEGNVVSLQILKNGHLKEHITKVEALLVCVSGKVVYEDEKGTKQILHTGEFINITPMVKHWVNGEEDSQLLLIK